MSSQLQAQVDHFDGQPIVTKRFLTALGRSPNTLAK